MEIYKNSSSEIQALIRSYYRPIHPCATLIKTEFTKFINTCYCYSNHIVQHVDISVLIDVEYFQGYKSEGYKNLDIYILSQDM